MAFVKDNVDHVSCESESNYADGCNKLMSGFEDVLQISTSLEINRSITSLQTVAKKFEDRARANPVQNATLENCKAVDKKSIKSSKVC